MNPWIAMNWCASLALRFCSVDVAGVITQISFLSSHVLNEGVHNLTECLTISNSLICVESILVSFECSFAVQTLNQSYSLKYKRCALQQDLLIPSFFQESYKNFIPFDFNFTETFVQFVLAFSYPSSGGYLHKIFRNFRFTTVNFSICRICAFFFSPFIHTKSPLASSIVYVFGFEYVQNCFSWEFSFLQLVYQFQKWIFRLPSHEKNLVVHPTVFLSLVPPVTTVTRNTSIHPVRRPNDFFPFCHSDWRMYDLGTLTR